jgi:hypothetical protein
MEGHLLYRQFGGKSLGVMMFISPSAALKSQRSQRNFFLTFCGEARKLKPQALRAMVLLGVFTALRVRGLPFMFAVLITANIKQIFSAHFAALR